MYQAEKQIQYQLFKLFYIEKDIQRLTNEMQEKQKELATVEQNKEKADEVLKEKKKEAGKITRELAELEQKIRVVVSIAYPTSQFEVDHHCPFSICRKAK